MSGNSFVQNTVLKKLEHFGLFISLFFLPICLSAQATNASTNTKITDDELIQQFIQSCGKDTIVFNASNIKQFWVDRSVSSQNSFINIELTDGNDAFKSVPLKIQLANVNEMQDCKITVIAKEHDAAFSVTDSKKKNLASSSSENDFLQFSVLSSTMHLEETGDFSFFINFNTTKSPLLTIKAIVLSFSNNQKTSFLPSPGALKLGKDELKTSNIESSDGTSFVMKGTRSSAFSKKNIYVSNNTISSSVKVKNIGKAPARIYIGYAAYTKDHVILEAKNYPLNKNSKTLHVVSFEKGSNKVIVDSYQEANGNCYVALNAKDDLSDIPICTLLDAKLLESKKLENGQGELVFNKPIDQPLKAGDAIRIHGLAGYYIYTTTKILQPGEEETFSATIKKDDTFLQYSSKALSRGVHYIVPLILSYTVDSQEENSVLISDYNISY